MEADYHLAAQELAKDRFYLGKVDGIKEKDLVTKLNVIEYPSLQYHKFSERFNYTGGRTQDAIVQWVWHKS